MRALLLCSVAWSYLHAAEWRAGRGAVKITPPSGIPMAGYFSVRLAESTHDDLYAKAVVLESGGKKAAIIACDLVSIDDELVGEARKLIESQTGIPAAHVMISATHSHTGPLLRKRLIGFAPAAAQKIAYAYRAALPAKIGAAAKLADTALVPVQMLEGVGREESISFYRRFLMKDGSVRTNPGKMNPEIVQPMGEIDPEVAVVQWESSGKPLATYVNFALHLDTVGGPQFSADYAFTLGRLLAKIEAPDLLTLFTIGAAGNINHVDVKFKEPQKGHAEAKRIGSILAGEVLKTLARLKPIVAEDLRVAGEVVKLPLPTYSASEVEKAKQAASQFGKPRSGGQDLVHAIKVLEVADRSAAGLRAEVQVIALGDRLAWVGLPGEIFVELGAAIKKASPFERTIVVELANGSIHYVPTRKAFQEGSYEPTNALCAPGGGELLADAAIRLLAKVHRR